MNIKDVESVLNHMGEQMTMKSIRKSLNKLGDRMARYAKFVACAIATGIIFIGWIIHRILS